MQRQLEYINQGRGGYIVYKDQESEMKFFFEFGAGNCVAIIHVPTIEEWNTRTNRPLPDRNSILTFVAAQAIKDQAPESYYEFSDSFIRILTEEIT